MASQGFTALMCFSAPPGDTDTAPAEGTRHGVPASAPAGPPRQPSERALRTHMLEKCLREAHEKAAQESAEPLWHGRIALLGLATLAVIRGVAWWQGNIPGYSVFGMHFLTTTADLACVLCALPLFCTGTRGQCVQVGCVGPMLTLVFAMSVVDIGALCAYLIVATPRPLAPGSRSYVDLLEACIGVWEFALVASVSLQIALCTSAWRVYKELRLTGLYPPGSNPAGVGKIEEVSLMELICEAEDVKFVNECQCVSGGDAASTKGDSSPGSPREAQVAR